MKNFECSIKDWHGKDEWSIVEGYVYDFQDAAKSAGSECFWYDPVALKEFELEIRIRQIGKTDFKTFKITAEPDLIFHADEL